MKNADSHADYDQSQQSLPFWWWMACLTSLFGNGGLIVLMLINLAIIPSTIYLVLLIAVNVIAIGMFRIARKKAGL